MPEKLVRDNIKAIMEEKGLQPDIRVADRREILRLALEKIAEELPEALQEYEKGDYPKLLGELVDIYDAFNLALSETLERLGMAPYDFDVARRDKRNRRGLFTKRHVLSYEKGDPHVGSLFKEKKAE
jgi:predicted house-cleaning noncanonical NTP pyrophosphatase (MazG superfamily)